MSQTVIFAEQTLGAYLDSDFGLYYIPIPSGLVLTAGQTYSVVWDGETYECIAQEATLGTDTGVGLGNLGMLGIGETTEEPFAIGADGTGGGIIYTTEEDEAHTVSIYQEAEESPGTDTEEAALTADVVLRDHDGVSVTYTGIKTVSFDTPNAGERATFTLGVEQTGKEVELSLKDGDQTVKADAGHLLRSLTIKKPASLQPENIRMGKTVGGVVGQFIGNIEYADVALDFSNGDQEVVPSSADKVLSKVTITKPETLIPENIRKDVVVAGITGNLVGDTEETTVVLNMADGDQVIVPSAEGKALSKVTIVKPATLVPGNIVEGVDIGGIIGTLGGDAPKVVMKSLLIYYSSTATTNVIFSADELAGIGFAEASDKFVLLIPSTTMYAYQSGGKTLLANFIRVPAISNQGTSKYYYGMTMYGSQSSSGTYSYAELVAAYPFGTTARTNTMYYADGAIVYDQANSTYKPYESTSRPGKYIAIAGVTA